MVSVKSRYGLCALTEMALNEERLPLPLHIVAKGQGLSLKYLEQVFSSLKKAGLVNSVKGSGGGYMFTKEPEDITVADVLLALEGSVAARTPEPESRLMKFLNKDAWAEVKKSMMCKADSISVKDLARAYLTDLVSGNMYYI